MLRAGMEGDQLRDNLLEMEHHSWSHQLAQAEEDVNSKAGAETLLMGTHE